MVCTIITPQEKQELSVAWIEINTPTGNYVIQRGHAPMILTIVPKKIILQLNSGKQETLITKTGGILHVDRLALTLLLNEKTTGY